MLKIYRKPIRTYLIFKLPVKLEQYNNPVPGLEVVISRVTGGRHRRSPFYLPDGV